MKIRTSDAAPTGSRYAGGARAAGPIAAHNDRWQMMLKQIVEFARMAEDLGVEMVALPQHHLHTEGLEVGSVPQLHLYVAMNTNHLRVGPIGYVLPGWNPLEIGDRDRMARPVHQRGAPSVGFARGYQHRWLNQMGQKLTSRPPPPTSPKIDKTNRKVFEEVFQSSSWRGATNPSRSRVSTTISISVQDRNAMAAA